MFQGDEDIYRALRLGAATYVLKGVRSEELLRTVRDVHAGKCLLPEPVATLLAGRSSHSLTAREVEILQLVREGLRNKEIAGVLHITEETTKTHVKNILVKLKVSDRTAAVNVALQRGVIHPR
jgi:DNA-binding NarL/FixJ family response regulator